MPVMGVGVQVPPPTPDHHHVTAGQRTFSRLTARGLSLYLSHTPQRAEAPKSGRLIEASTLNQGPPGPRVLEPAEHGTPTKRLGDSAGSSVSLARL